MSVLIQLNVSSGYVESGFLWFLCEAFFFFKCKSARFIYKAAFATSFISNPS